MNGVKKIWLLLACLCAIIVAVTGWNGSVAWPVASALSGEKAHAIVAYRRWLLSPNDVVIDVWSVNSEMSMADMDRMLFKAAEGLRNRSYARIILAYHGRAKLLLEGAEFRTIGETRQTQNPIYTMRTMQEFVTNMDGSPAFGHWTGGWLGVLGKQLEDHKEFHARWWLRDALGLGENASLGRPES